MTKLLSGQPPQMDFQRFYRHELFKWDTSKPFSVYVVARLPYDMR